jgi:hypothetical protein
MGYEMTVSIKEPKKFPHETRDIVSTLLAIRNENVHTVSLSGHEFTCTHAHTVDIGRWR